MGVFSFTRPTRNVSVSDNKFIFNSVDLSNKVMVENIRRTLVPSKDFNSINIPGRDGRYVFDSTYGVRTISLDIRIVEDTYEDAVETQLYLAGVLNQREDKELHLRDFAELELHNMATLSEAVDLTRNKDTLTGELVFTCSSPFNYANTITAYSIDDVGVVVTNGGINIQPTITLDIAEDIAGNIEISTDDGQNLILIGPFVSGSEVVYSNYTLRVNGALTNTKIDIVNSSFIELKNGDTTLTVTGLTLTSCVVGFKEAYI